MLTRRIVFGATLVTLAGMGAVLAQQSDPLPPGAPGAPEGQRETIRAKQVLGSKVNIQGDMAVGTVDDIVLDDHGNVDYLIVANSDGRLVTVPWGSFT
jgi:hypothetical protein